MAATSSAPATNHEPRALSSTAPAAQTALSASGRVTGEALRRSLSRTTLAWMFGAFWWATAMGLAQAKLAKYLGANDSRFGVLAAMPLLAALLQIPGSLWIERMGSRKKIFLLCGTSHRVLYLLIAALPWFLAPSTSSALVFAAIVFLSMSCNAIGGQAWTSWMADMVPARVRGKYFARRGRYAISVMVVTALLIGVLLDVCEHVQAGPATGLTGWTAQWDHYQRAGFALVEPIATRAGMPAPIFVLSILFAIATISGTIDILMFKWIDEPTMARTPHISLWAKLSEPLRDTQFMRFCAHWAIWTFSVCWTGAMWWPYFLDFMDRLDRAGVHPWWAQYRWLMGTVLIGVGYQVGQFLGYPMWGHAVDKFGRKPVLFASSTLHTTTWIALLFLSPKLAPWLPITQVVAGFVGGGQEIGSLNMMLQFNRKGGPGYQATGTVLFSLVGAVGALLAGQFAQSMVWCHGHLTAMAGADTTMGAAAQGLLWFHKPLFAGTGWEVQFNRYTLVIVIGFVIKFVADLLVLPKVRDLQAKPAEHAFRFVLQSTYGNLDALIFTPLSELPQNARRHLDNIRKLGERITDKIGDTIFRG